MSPITLTRTITLGQAYVRIIESTGVLLERKPAWTERLLLKLVRSLYTHRLRGLVAELPADVTGEILKASERIRETAITVSMNRGCRPNLS